MACKAPGSRGRGVDKKESVYNEMLNGFRCMLLHCTIKSARIAALRVVVHAA